MRIEKNAKVRWIDIVNPSDEDLAFLRSEFSIHPVILDEIKQPSSMARVEVYKEYLYFIHYFPRYDTTDESSQRAEVDMIVTKSAVITVRYEDVGETFSSFRLKRETSSLAVVCELLKHLMKFEERQLRHIREKVEAVSKELFAGHEADVLRRITYLKRDVSEYRIIARLQEGMVRSLASKGVKFWGGDAEVYLTDLLGDQLKIVNQVADYREAITDFEGTNNQLMNLKINRVMQRLTSLSGVAFPVLLLAGLFTMGAKDTPLVHMENGFWIILCIMAALVLVTFAYFRRKNWI